MSDQQMQAVMEVRYGVQYNAANERLYRRLKFVFDFASLFAGSTAVVSFVNKSPDLAAVAGVALAALAAVNQLVSPGEMATRFNEAYRRFVALDRQASTMTAEAIRDAVGAIRADAPWGVDAIGPYVYNRCLTSNGFEDGHMALTRWQRFISLLA